MITRRLGYRDLAATLREKITTGQLRPGDRIPSETDLIGEYGVARETARRAVRLLRDEGLVEVRHGYPSRVRSPQAVTEVRIQRGSRWIVRMPSPVEREELSIGEGVPVVVVTLGAKTAIYPGDRHAFTCS